ncbi:putative mitogen activated protein kinase [Trypanosoma cruzi]|uniref:Mitogen activated protein kinase, putative n=3 Tax=Trypanosoma cruzi TaxID=5693 RepID=Q4CZQ7_TRYCC|nr:mitogen activated protein kinase, putative [Trypanosoma cruzi]EAN85754.1 mitogen activated protein kinase, putative [Trypanosoma cruzi]KAF8297529.1 putative mitogen-activated protein kinase 11 [Trypanosoma cruzi]PWV11535.1 putative mitogen activated protein kinase [Trypanosoma cruzi]|eukprot:XP_807605.1 mitogen activated protein kinase [Trypanosoma cruzi strain CL Brener]
MSHQIRSLSELQEEVNSLDSRYVLEKIIGAGSYGIVIRARDTLNDNELVALKRVNKEIFEEMILAKRVLREIKLLSFFNDENIIALRNILTPLDSEDFDHFYIVMEIMETDLKQVLRTGQELTEAHVQFFIYQILHALKVIHTAGVIHRDITPANILVNQNCDLKICDFGLAKEENDRGENMTDYVTMRWYRAPELVMEDKNYSAQIDVWGVGSILGELLGSRPLFQGKDRVRQLDKIIEVIGTPSEEDIKSLGSLPAQKYLRKKETRPPLDWRAKYPKASEEALDLLKRMLVFHPDKRITVDEALRHPFLAELYDEQYETINIPLFSFDEQEQKTVHDVKKAVYEESVMFHEKYPKTAPRHRQLQHQQQQQQQQQGGSALPSMDVTGEGRSAQRTIERDNVEDVDNGRFDEMLEAS